MEMRKRDRLDMAAIAMALVGMFGAAIVMFYALTSMPVSPTSAVNMRPECQYQANQWLAGNKGE